MKSIYHSHNLDVYHFMFYCKSCGKLNVVFREYTPFTWENCQHCEKINCVCPSIQDEQIQDRVNPTTEN